jgi:hypothetical protein
MKDTVLIGAACVAAIALGAWLYFSGTSGVTGPLPSKAGAAAVTFSVLDQGTNAVAITERKNFRIKNQEELDELWKMTHGEGTTVVDFSQHDVIAVYDGIHPTGGYEVSVAAVADSPDPKRTVAIVHTEPGASCVTTEAMTSPFQLIIVPKSEAPLAREDQTAIRDCN